MVLTLTLKDLEKRLNDLGIYRTDEVSYTLDGCFCTTTMEMYINLLKQGRNVSMYHLTHGNPARCCAMYLKAVGEALDDEIEGEEHG